MWDRQTDSIVPAAWCNFVFDYPEYAGRTSVAVPADLPGSLRQVNVVPQQPLALTRQSYNTTDPFIPIPEQVLANYSRYRPTPLRRAEALERHLGVNARIYYKFEGANVSGSHKLNTALAQAFYYARAGVEHLVTGTGAGQWGTALAYACKLLGIECTVFMLGASYRQKPLRATIDRGFSARRSTRARPT